eukprot:TRINITY_DN2310_c0_g2_i1.p1 TRINITY_DN2310_c0_g2~~TRINITY_DN2310_c0_g2_i1.p1  ORF type:complete len:100 (-),score=6.75 TRINITY_DN2310_c0_g2_i1:10-309(-)
MNAIGLFDYWIIAIAALFVIVNPLTTAFMFVSLLPRTSETTRKAVAKRSSLIATGVFFCFCLTGWSYFQHIWYYHRGISYCRWLDFIWYCDEHDSQGTG